MIRTLRDALRSRPRATALVSRPIVGCSPKETDLTHNTVRRLRIGYVPGHAEGNAYVQRTQEALAELGQVYPLSPSTKSLWRLLKFRPGFFDVIIVNWLEYKIANPVTGRLSWAGVLAYYLQILSFRIFCRRLVYLRHNTYPHHANSRSADTLTRIIDLSERLYSITATHSGHFADKHYLPHPLYQEYPMTAKGNHFIVFGRVMPYKNIEQLISHFPVDEQLIVAGPCDDQPYFRKLQAVAEGRKVEFIPRYLSEEEAQCLVGTARGLILSHADNDMIVSGSFFYALSLGTPVIAVRTPFFNWVQDELDLQGLTLVGEIESIGTALKQQLHLPAEVILRSARQYFSLVTVTACWDALFAQLQLQDSA